jgi:hypothetical protein
MGVNPEHYTLHIRRYQWRLTTSTMDTFHGVWSPPYNQNERSLTNSLELEFKEPDDLRIRRYQRSLLISTMIEFPLRLVISNQFGT